MISKNKKQRRTYVYECNQRLKLGMAPCEEAQNEWNRYLKSKKWKKEKCAMYEVG